jgi:hypothetical protein
MTSKTFLDKLAHSYDLGICGPAFKSFVLNSLVLGNSSNVTSYYDEFNDGFGNRYDAYFPSGLESLGTNGNPTYLEIKYSNQTSSYFSGIIKNFLKYYKNNEILCVISASKGHECFPQFKGRVIFKGHDFIKHIASNNQALWWRFSAVADSDAKIEKVDENTFELRCQVLGFEDFTPKINFKDISIINEANKTDFNVRARSNHEKIAMIVGNGSSIAFGSDTWQGLATSLADHLHPYYADNVGLVCSVLGGSTYASASLAESTLPQDEYYSTIYQSIYRKYQQKMHTDYTLVRSITNAKYYHKDMPLYTYNYDCFIEDDYKIKFQSSELKTVEKASYISRTPEPFICHLHGFFGKNKKHTKLVLSDSDYFNQYLSHRKIRMVHMELLEKYTCLFVGSSMSDFFQMSLIDEAKKHAAKAKKPWKCFALMCFKDLGTNDILLLCNYYLSKGIYVIWTKTFLELPKVLDGLMQF